MCLKDSLPKNEMLHHLFDFHIIQCKILTFVLVFSGTIIRYDHIYFWVFVVKLELF